MDTLKDIWASIAAGVKDRTTNPLTFSFLLSWSIWNYKFFVILLGDGTTSEKLTDIEGMYPNVQATYAGGALLFPIVTALLYVFAYPFLSQAVIKFYRGRQVRLANTIKEIEGTRVLTHKEATALTRRHEAERKKWEDTESSLDGQLGELRNALAAAEQQITEQRTKLAEAAAPAANTDSSRTMLGPEEEAEEGTETTAEPPTTTTLNNETSSAVSALPISNQRILLLFSDSPSGFPASELAVRLNANYSVILVMLEDMQKLGLVTLSATGRWMLTPNGRRIAVDLLTSEK